MVMLTTSRALALASERIGFREAVKLVPLKSIWYEIGFPNRILSPQLHDSRQLDHHRHVRPGRPRRRGKRRQMGLRRGRTIHNTGPAHDSGERRGPNRSLGKNYRRAACFDIRSGITKPHRIGVRVNYGLSVGDEILQHRNAMAPDCSQILSMPQRTMQNVLGWESQTSSIVETNHSCIFMKP